MRTIGKRKGRREVPSHRGGKRTRKAGQPSPSTGGGGGGGGGGGAGGGAGGRAAHLPDPVAAAHLPDPVAAAHLPDPVAAAHLPHTVAADLQAASPVASTPSPVSVSSPSSGSYQTVTAGKRSLQKKHRDVAQLLKNYLQSEGSFLIDEMWEQKKFELCIDFFVLRRVADKGVVDKICNQKSKLMQAVTSDAAREAVLESFKNKDYTLCFPDEEAMITTVLHKFNLNFENLPGCISSLESTIANLRGIALRTLFESHSFTRKVVDMNEELRRLLDSCFQKMLHAHQQNCSWNGKWGIDDWSFINDEIFYFDFEDAPTMYENPGELLAACKADLRTFARAIISKFAIKGAYPAYLQNLFNELDNEAQNMTLDDYFGSKEERDYWAYFSGCGWYMHCLEFHPAVMTAVARLGLIEGWYLCVISLQYDEWPEFKLLISEYLKWMDIVQGKIESDVDRILWLTFWHKAKKPMGGGGPSTWNPQYKNTWAKKLLFLRQLCFHTYRYTKITGGRQSILDEAEPELNAARELPDFLPEFIKLLLSEGRMTCGFSRYYAAYCKQR